MRFLLKEYKNKKESIISRLEEFKDLPKEDYLDEFLFCILTPQSNAKKCWTAIEEIKSNNFNKNNISFILKGKTRFHNNKTKYVLLALNNWNKIKSNLNKKDILELRNWLSENVKGYGLKEASHFLRNIGKSDNKIAILDRHILKNLKSLNIIKNDKIKNKSDYFKKERQFLEFSKQIKIPIDELDLLFWSNENGEIFK
ncbi:MAG: DNA lyase [archaeon]|nr:DNA lyase [archaeon]